MLAIILDNPNATYAQGDRVRGQVTFERNYSTSLGLVTVHIQVTGRTKTTIYDTSAAGDSHGETDLFFLKVGEASGSNVAFSFDFAFPGHASPVDPGVASTRHCTQQVMTIPSNHLLPPTFDHRNPKFAAVVEYQIRASVWAPAQSRRLSEKSLPIIYSPRHDPDSPLSAQGNFHSFTTCRPSQANLRSLAPRLWNRSRACVMTSTSSSSPCLLGSIQARRSPDFASWMGGGFEKLLSEDIEAWLRGIRAG